MVKNCDECGELEGGFNCTCKEPCKDCGKLIEECTCFEECDLVSFVHYKVEVKKWADITPKQLEDSKCKSIIVDGDNKIVKMYW